jgi:hypothetical protein
VAGIRGLNVLCAAILELQRAAQGGGIVLKEDDRGAVRRRIERDEGAAEVEGGAGVGGHGLHCLLELEYTTCMLREHAPTSPDRNGMSHLRTFPDDLMSVSE